MNDSDKKNSEMMQCNQGSKSLSTAVMACLFGSEFFQFTDYRVAELITAFGRRVLGYMKHIAEKVYGLNVIAGDTDSIFVTDVKGELDIHEFLAECFIMLEDTEIKLVKEYKKFLLLGKNHYLGIHGDETLEPEKNFKWSSDKYCL